ncbi:hypothetical protein SB14R_02640 [Pseudomonas oryzihabitans]|nr:hypothetical protein SB14R_02640 [Pseudomonas psychrotolerans]
MIVVEKFILFWKANPSGIERCRALLPHTQKYEPCDDVEFWNKNFQILRRLDPRLQFTDLDEIHDIYSDWVRSPAFVSQTQTSYRFFSTDPMIGHFGEFTSVLQNTQEKAFPKVEHLFRALLGNYRAKTARAHEEELALHVLANVERYEVLFLDKLIIRIQQELRGVKKESPYGRGESYYGASATVNWSVGDVLVQMSDSEPLERLYKKIAAIHDFCRCMRFKTPGRNDHASMRVPDDKYSLNEEHSDVFADRAKGVSVWAGKSGSAMDMIYGAIQMGIDDPDLLTHLAFCIFAFFHFMPTIRSATHTYNEVMRGAQSICPKISYNPNDPNVPILPHPVGL